MSEAPGSIGTPAILILKDAKCLDCGGVHDTEKCPDCGSYIELGYGLAGGGCGIYKYCTNGSCGWFWKEFDQAEDS